MTEEKKNTKAKSKNKNTKTKSKKKTTKKNKKKTLKQVIFNKENCLIYTFILLIIVVIVLGVLVYEASNKKTDKANLSIPVYQKGLSEEFDINLKKLSHKKYYSVKIRNYRDEKINTEEMPYEIIIVNNTKSKIKITKDDADQNLMVDQKSTKIEGVKLKANIEDEDIYYFSVIDKKKITKDDKIYIEIKS